MPCPFPLHNSLSSLASPNVFQLLLKLVEHFNSVLFSSVGVIVCFVVVGFGLLRICFVYCLFLHVEPK